MALEERIISERELGILRRHHGLSGEKRVPLSVIGESLGVSKERVRMIEKQAMGKLGLTKEDFDRSVVIRLHHTDSV